MTKNTPRFPDRQRVRRLRHLRPRLPERGDPNQMGRFRPCGRGKNASAAGSVRMYALRRSSTWWKGAVHCEKHKEKRGGRTTFGSPSCATCFWGCSISCSHGWGCCFSVSRCSSPFSAAAKPTATATAGAASFSACWEKAEMSRNTPPPKFLRSPWFRYGFLTFFMVMFGLMLFSTYRVFTGAPLSQTVTLLWVFKLPWQWADVSFVAPWIGQFAFGFFGVMLTSTVLGLLTMVLFRPRSWCVYCPMGTMTQGICKLRNGKKAKEYGRTGKENSGAAEASGE